MIAGDFNRKDINWDTVSSSSEDDCKFIEALRDSFLTQHILTPTRGRGTNDPSLLDILFTSNEENIESIELHAPLGKSDHSMIKVKGLKLTLKNPNGYYLVVIIHTKIILLIF